jgi:hypothetical protein
MAAVIKAESGKGAKYCSGPRLPEGSQDDLIVLAHALIRIGAGSRRHCMEGRMVHAWLEKPYSLAAELQLRRA